MFVPMLEMQFMALRIPLFLPPLFFQEDLVIGLMDVLTGKL